MAKGLGAEPGAGGAWLRLLLSVLARVYLAFLLTLVVAALVPTLGSWTSYAVRSGSMEPALAVGDVVVAQPFSPSDPVPVGRVMVFENPALPGRDQTLVHRIVEYLGAGEYVSAGDANKDVDATPVRDSDLLARARILVPMVGLPLVWLRGGDLVLLAGWVLLTLAALAMARLRRPEENDPGSPAARAGTHRGRRSHDHHAVRSAGHAAARQWRPVMPFFALALLTALTGLALGGGPGPGILPAAAGFSETTRNPANQWSVGVVVHPYNAAVLADEPYVFHLLDEEAGASAADYSGNRRAGTYAAIGAYRQPGALSENPGYAVSLGGGTGRLVTGGNALVNPTTFSLELWFRTTTTTGGKLIGFESSRNATSASYDRHVFMNNSGRLVFGAWSASTIRTVTSPAAYNDGEWHHLVLTAVPRGQQQDAIMYVDGVEVSRGTTSRTSNYSGWWRVGYGNLATGTGYPTTRGFAGRVDQPAVYLAVLSAARVSAHHDAR